MYLTSTDITDTVTVNQATALESYRFEAVDGGLGRACRGSSPGDNSANHYNATRPGKNICCWKKWIFLMEERKWIFF